LKSDDSSEVFFEKTSASKAVDCRGFVLFVFGPVMLAGFGKRYVLVVLLAVALLAVGLWLIVRGWYRLGVRVTDHGFVVQGPLGNRVVPFEEVVTIRSYPSSGDGQMWYLVDRGNYEEPLAGDFRSEDLWNLSIALKGLNVPIGIDAR
jgi:hypothetical protein